MLPFLSLAFFNPAKIFAFVVENWKPLLFIGLIATVFVQKWWYADTIEDLEMLVASQANAIEICEEGNNTLAADIQRRNDEITKWKETSLILEQKNLELLGIVQDMRKSTEGKVDEILNDPTPQTCEDSIKYLIDGTEDLTW